MQQIIDAIVRYHRKNPLRVAFGTPQLLAGFPAEQIEQAYRQLADQGHFEPVYHTVERNGGKWQCYRITKQGLTAQPQPQPQQAQDG